VKPWERHDEFVPGTISGWIDLTIEALTPVFIRGPVTQLPDGTWDTRGSRLRSTPFLDHQGRPIIPGSSLRGMLRHLVEIVSYSKIQPVSNKRPFFRTIPRTSDDRIGRAYQNNIVKDGNKPAGGFAERRGDDWVIVPASEVLRVPHSVLEVHGFAYQVSPRYRLNWSLHQKRVAFRRDRFDSVIEICLAPKSAPDWEFGVLVLTGCAPKPAKGSGKAREFLFVGRNDSLPISIPSALVDGSTTTINFRNGSKTCSGSTVPFQILDDEQVSFVTASQSSMSATKQVICSSSAAPRCSASHTTALRRNSCHRIFAPRNSATSHSRSNHPTSSPVQRDLISPKPSLAG
jgi:hypothetical protein